MRNCQVMKFICRYNAPREAREILFLFIIDPFSERAWYGGSQTGSYKGYLPCNYWWKRPRVPSILNMTYLYLLMQICSIWQTVQILIRCLVLIKTVCRPFCGHLT